VLFFKNREEAEQAGYRPCKQCRPDFIQYDPESELAQRVKHLYIFILMIVENYMRK
jgi:AraC family transcriptional regulator of adaptative response / methylphosphotriester-DNA alkyltransferase methyltransferase